MAAGPGIASEGAPRVSRHHLPKLLLAGFTIGLVAAIALKVGMPRRRARLRLARWRVEPRDWQGRDPLRMIVIAGLRPGTSPQALRHLGAVVARINALAPDLVILLGAPRIAGFVPEGESGADHPATTRLPEIQIAAHLAALQAPLGRFWLAGDGGAGDPIWPELLADAGFAPLDHQARRIGGAKRGFWLAGLGASDSEGGARASHPLAPLAGGGDEAPTVLIAPTPDIFADLDDLAPQVSLVVSAEQSGPAQGIGGFAPQGPDRACEDYPRGRYDESGRTLIVSGAISPAAEALRSSSPPEITLIEISEPQGW